MIFDVFSSKDIACIYYTTNLIGFQVAGKARSYFVDF